MKLFKIFLFTIIYLSVINCGAKENAPPASDKSSKESSKSYKRYGVKKGMVEYELSGSKTGKKILYFDDWGMKEASYETGEMKVMGMSIKENRLTIIDGVWTIGIDLDKKTGTKMKTPLLDKLIERSESGDLTEFGEEMLKQMGGKIIGQEVVLGKNCDIWEIKNFGSKSWVWNYVPIKSETNFMGQTIIITATKIDFDSDIPEGKIKIPDDVTITEGQDMKSIFDKIKKGKKN